MFLDDIVGIVDISNKNNLLYWQNLLFLIWYFYGEIIIYVQCLILRISFYSVIWMIKNILPLRIREKEFTQKIS